MATPVKIVNTPKDIDALEEFMDDPDAGPQVQMLNQPKIHVQEKPKLVYFLNKQTLEISTALEVLDVRNFREDSRYREITEHDSIELKNILALYRQKFAQLLGVHKGQDIHILANGPSLSQYGYNIKWANLITIGINAAPLFLPNLNYWLLVDKLHQPNRPLFKFMMDWYEKQRNTVTIMNEASVDHLIEHQNIHPSYCFQSSYRGVSKNALYWYGSSTHAALDLALKMGAQQVFLWGVDYSNRGHFYTGVILNDNLDQPSSQWENMEKHVLGFQNLAVEAKRLGVQVFNCNPESKLDVFPKINPYDVFPEYIDVKVKPNAWTRNIKKSTKIEIPAEVPAEVPVETPPSVIPEKQFDTTATYNFSTQCLELRSLDKMMVIPFSDLKDPKSRYLLTVKKSLESRLAEMKNKI